MSIFLQALSLENYRGIGPKVQIITGFRKLNFFIGANNAGKSILLNFISAYIDSDQIRDISQIEYNSVERFRGEGSGPAKAFIGIRYSDVISEIEGAEIAFASTGKDIFPFVKEIVQFSSDQDHLWLEKVKNGRDYIPSNFNGDILKNDEYSRNWSHIWRNFRPGSSGGGLELWKAEGRKSIASFIKFREPKSSIIPAKRQLGPKDETFEDLSGKGLIDQLAEIQSPDHHEREKREIFDQINEFVRNVVGKQEAQIEVPHDRKHLVVHIDGKVLPLSSLGTGIHEVILIAAFCALK